jgi:signal transduction histidine kinase
MGHMGQTLVSPAVETRPQGRGTIKRGANYRGPDRRGVIANDRGWPGKLFLVAGIGLLVLMLVVASAPDWLTGLPGSRVGTLGAQLDAVSVALAVGFAALCVVRWRLIGEASALWLGAAGAMLAAFSLGSGLTAGFGRAVVDSELLWLHPATRIVFATLILLALFAPEVDARLRPGRIFVAAFGATAVLTLGFQLIPGSATPAMQQFIAMGAPAADGVGMSALFVALWVVLASCLLWRGVTHRRPSLAWFGLLLFALSLAELTRMMASTDVTVWTAAPSLLRTYGLVGVTGGALIEVMRAYAVQDSKLLESVTSRRTAEARVEEQRASHAELAHEAHNALAAIEGATRTLQGSHDHLDPTFRAELSEAIGAEIRRLQHLVSLERPAQRPGRFWVSEALAAVVTCARSLGSSVVLDVPEDLVAIGHPADTAQVLQNLFQNAQRYAGGTIVVRARLEGDEVVIRVEDDGPGLAEEDRERIFERGVRGSEAEGSPGEGLGLYVSTRLMEEQGGHLRLDDKPGGGASFAVVLPGFSELELGRPSVEDALDDAEQAAQTVVRRKLSLVRLADHRHATPVLIEDDGDVRDDVAR